MKKLLIFIAVFLIAFGLTLSQPQTIAIMHLNDSHSCLLPGGPRDNQLNGLVGGIARVATVVDNIRQIHPNALLLHCGDFSVGDLFYCYYLAVPELMALMGIGCDAIGLQNHEFDLGPAMLLNSIASVYSKDNKVPIIATNVFFNDESVKPFLDFVQPYLIKDYNGVKIGILSLTHPKTNTFSSPAPVEISDDISNILTQQVTALKMQGCDIVVLMSGAGMYYDRIIAQNSIFIDIIIGGDDHYVLNEPVIVKNAIGQNVYIVQSGPFYRNLGLFTITFEGTIQNVSWTNYLLDENIPEKEEIKLALEHMKEEIEQLYEQPFTTQVTENWILYEEERTPEELKSYGYQDTRVGTLVCKSYKEWIQYQSTEPEGDFYFTAGGSTAQPLYPGPIVKADIFRMIGYGFNTDNTLGYRLARVRVTGEQLVTGLSIGLSMIDENDEFLIQTEDLKYTYNSYEESDKRLLGVWVKDEPVELERIYTAYTNEFLAYFMHSLGLLVDFEVLPYTSEYLAVLNYVQRHMLTGHANTNILNIAEPTNVNVENHISFSVNAYPNPANNYINFTFTELPCSTITLAIIDNSGKVVKSFKNLIINNNNYECNIQDLTSGSYQYIIICGSSVKYGKFVVLR